MSNAPRGYPKTFRRLSSGFVVGLIGSVFSVLIGVFPVIVLGIVGVLPVEPLWAAAAGMMITSAAWVGVERVSADTESGPTPEEWLQIVSENFWSVALLFALLVIYTNLLAITAGRLAVLVAGSSSSMLALYVAFHAAVLDLALARRFSTSPIGLVIYLIAVLLEYRSASEDTHIHRLPLVGLRLPGDQSSGLRVP